MVQVFFGLIVSWFLPSFWRIFQIKIHVSPSIIFIYFYCLSYALFSSTYFVWTYSELFLYELILSLFVDIILNLFTELRTCFLCLILSELILNRTYLNLFWTLFVEPILNYSDLNLSELILKLLWSYLLNLSFCSELNLFWTKLILN